MQLYLNNFTNLKKKFRHFLRLWKIVTITGTRTPTPSLQSLHFTIWAIPSHDIFLERIWQNISWMVFLFHFQTQWPSGFPPCPLNYNLRVNLAFFPPFLFHDNLRGHMAIFFPATAQQYLWPLCGFPSLSLCDNLRSHLAVFRPFGFTIISMATYRFSFLTTVWQPP